MIKTIVKAAAVGVVVYTVVEALRRSNVADKAVGVAKVASAKLTEAWPFTAADDPTPVTPATGYMPTAATATTWDGGS